MISTGLLPVLITTFLASAVEATEMVTIVVGVGATRGWRSTIIGAVSGFGALAVIVVVLGAALSRIPIGPLRLIVGFLLLVFGLQWFRKGITRVAARGLAGMAGGEPHHAAGQRKGARIDLARRVPALKGGGVEGLGVNWPASDATIVVLLIVYAATALTCITVLRRRAPQMRVAV